VRQIILSGGKLRTREHTYFLARLFYLINRLSTKRRIKGAIINKLGKAMIQLFNQAVIHKPKNASVSPAVLRTETPDTTQDMQSETKNINVTCPYFAGIIQTTLMFLSL
tara:strand:- start:548 stop:874 length:327 start_codon:yes stop_codon:yes gene_type:complete